MGYVSPWPVIKEDTRCFIIYWVDYGFNKYLTIDKIRNYVLDILLSWFWGQSVS